MTKPKMGPKTEEGRMAVAANAVHHGITSTSPVIEGMESHEDWQCHLDGISESLAPEGFIEQAPAGRVANLLGSEAPDVDAPGAEAPGASRFRQRPGWGRLRGRSPVP